MANAFPIGLFLSIATLIIQSGSALNCTKCVSLTGWESCTNASVIVPCSVVDVNYVHEALKPFNPTLHSLPESTTNVSFQCFSLEVMSNEPSAQQEIERRFVSGCTFKPQKFCEGWNDAIRLVGCDTCETQDICSLKEENDGNNGNGAGYRVMVNSMTKYMLGLMALMNLFCRKPS